MTRGSDFKHNGCNCQVKANRPSGRPGSTVTLVSKAKNDGWHRLIWILYNEKYEMQEAWQWDVNCYKEKLGPCKNVRPKDMRDGQKLYSAKPSHNPLNPTPPPVV